MRSLAILSVYDSQGIVDKYLSYFGTSLMKAVDELIVVINGKVNDEGMTTLEEITDKILVRDNIGFDAGGYRAAMDTYGKEYILSYDQVIICNDTCFGPFVPFKEIFAQMDQNSADFWGFQYVEYDFMSSMGTFFIAFRKNVLNDVYDYLMGLDIDHMTRSDVVRMVEIGLSQFLLDKKYKYVCYSNTDDYDVYKAPNYCIRQCGAPLMKKRCFDPIKYHKDNCIDALKYIEANYEYDIELILSVIKRKYDITYDLEYEYSRVLHTQDIKFPALNSTLEDINLFVQSDKDVYIYGTGFYGKLLMERISACVKGFVISDERYTEEYVMNKKVYKYSSIKNDDCKIVVAILDADEIKRKLQNRKDVLYLL